MGYKTIKRDEGGNWQPIDGQLASGKSAGKNEINKRHELRQRELEDAIAKDSSPATGEGEKMIPDASHNVTESAVQRLRADRNLHADLDNADKQDRPEKTAKRG